MKRFLCILAAVLLCLGTICFPKAGEEEGNACDTAEAEQGELLGGAYVTTRAGHTYVEGLKNAGDGVAVILKAPEDGFYDVVVSTFSDSGHKENDISVDGVPAGSINTDYKRWQDSVLERVYLSRGEHRISVTKSWGWIRIDTVRIVPSETVPEDLFQVSPTLCNPDASSNARRLMAYLCDCYGKKILSGQYCDDGMYGAENAAVWRATGGSYPAVLGMDMMEYTPNRVAHGSTCRTVQNAIDYWNAGGIVTLCWHWSAPQKYVTGKWYSAFYTDQTNLNLGRIMNGLDSEGYDLLMNDIDAIAQKLTLLRDAGVPVLWRPLHEASGGWFWWGASGSEAYIKLYRLLYGRLTNEYGLNNLIWVWNGQDEAWYPGDDCVDILGIDIYPGERVYASQITSFIRTMKSTPSRKIIALSENGCLPDPELCARDGAMWSWVCTWSGEFVLKNKAYNLISEQYTEKEMLCRFYADDRVVTRADLPYLPDYPLPEK